jgi:hypothetical protein
VRTLLLATVMLAFAAPAFALPQPQPQIIAGDVNLATTSAGSNAGVSSSQGTMANVKAAGNGAVIVGAVSGNYTSVQTTALGTASPAGSYTDTTATQTNIGGTVAAGAANQMQKRGGASGTAGGGQYSTASGNSTATASNANLGGVVVLPAKQGPHH